MDFASKIALLDPGCPSIAYLAFWAVLSIYFYTKCLNFDWNMVESKPKIRTEWRQHHTSQYFYHEVFSPAFQVSCRHEIHKMNLTVQNHFWFVLKDQNLSIWCGLLCQSIYFQASNLYIWYCSCADAQWPIWSHKYIISHHLPSKNYLIISSKLVINCQPKHIPKSKTVYFHFENFLACAQ